MSDASRAARFHESTLAKAGRAFTSLGAILMLFGLPSRAAAQDQPGAAGWASISIHLDPGYPPSPIPFWVDDNMAVRFSLGSVRRDLRLIFKDPQGMLWDIAAPSSDTPQADPGSTGTTYQTIIDRPAPGRWNVTVLAPEPLDMPVRTSLEIEFRNGVRAKLAAPKKILVMGDSMPVTLELLDNGRRIRDLRPTVLLTRPGEAGDVPAFVAFRDDGGQGDPAAEDGIYTALLAAGAPGTFRLEAQVEASTSAGHSQRSCELTFKVVPKAARITGNITQRILVGTPE